MLGVALRYSHQVNYEQQLPLHRLWAKLPKDYRREGPAIRNEQRNPQIRLEAMQRKELNSSKVIRAIDAKLSQMSVPKIGKIHLYSSRICIRYCAVFCCLRSKKKKPMKTNLIICLRDLHLLCCLKGLHLLCSPVQVLI